MAEQKQKYIPLSEIAPLTPYTTEYLALLAGRGRLKAVQKDGVWYTTMEWVNEYVVWLNNQMEAMNESFEVQVTSFKTEELKPEAQPQPVASSRVIASAAPAERSNPAADSGIATVASTLHGRASAPTCHCPRTCHYQ